MRIFGLLLLSFVAAAAEEIVFPTKNQALLEGRNEAFFCPVDRIENGVRTTPWEGGTYGMVRTPIVWQGQEVMTQFHEGIDILPLQRDARGEPMDVVGAIADGKVAYVSDQPGASNYGRYVVVEHVWSGTPVYSLYAHFGRVIAKVGEPVKAGDALGILGHTGAGINLRRSHVHLEINLMCTTDFNDFLSGGKALDEKQQAILLRHGNFHGVNLMGYDAAAFYRAKRENPELKFSDFVRTLPFQYKIFVPNRGGLPEMAKRYPWLVRGAANWVAGAKSWEISFTRTGQVIAFTPSARVVDGPTLGEVRAANAPLKYLTRGIVRERGEGYELSPGGRKLALLVSGEFAREKSQPSTETKL